MANLIPQKQVREVDNFRVDVNFEQNVTISGSATIAEDLLVGGNTTIEGSLFASQSFNLGSNPNEKSTLSGSVEITGSLKIDGPLSFANAQNRLDATASYADEALNSLLFDNFTSQDFQAQRPTLYVSSTAPGFADFFLFTITMSPDSIPAPCIESPETLSRNVCVGS